MRPRLNQNRVAIELPFVFGMPKSVLNEASTVDYHICVRVTVAKDVHTRAQAFDLLAVRRAAKDAGKLRRLRTMACVGQKMTEAHNVAPSEVGIQSPLVQTQKESSDPIVA